MNFVLNFVTCPVLIGEGKTPYFILHVHGFSFSILRRRMKVPITACFTFTQMIIMLTQAPFFSNLQPKSPIQNTTSAFFLHNFLNWKLVYLGQLKRNIFHGYV